MSELVLCGFCLLWRDAYRTLHDELTQGNGVNTVSLDDYGRIAKHNADFLFD